MHRSSSIATMKIDFNPSREATTGSSSIDRLPIRKSNSLKSIPQCPYSQVSHTESQNQSRTPGTVMQSQQYSIEMLKRINQSLERENVYLKKQLDFFTQACSSKRSSINNIVTAANTGSKKKQDPSYRDKIMGRITGGMEKNDNTESTGLFNSKISSGRKGDQPEDPIGQAYSKYTLKGQLPKIETLKQLTSSFLESIKENYMKLKIIVEEIGKKKETLMLKQITEVLGFLETVVLWHRNPKSGKNMLQDKTAKTSQMINQLRSNNNNNNQQKIEDLITEALSATQLTSIFEMLVKIGIKNSKFVTSLRSSISFTRLVKRMAKNQ